MKKRGGCWSRANQLSLGSSLRSKGKSHPEMAHRLRTDLAGSTPALRHIKTKAEMYELYNRGAFGNRLKTWNSFEELEASGRETGICVRYKKPGNKWTYFALDLGQVRNAIRQAVYCEGADRSLFHFNELGPDDKIILQGEVMRTHEGLVLSMNNQPNMMHRMALKDPETVYGLEARGFLLKHLEPSSYDDLMELLEIYPDSIIEFTAYSVCVGVCRGRNTIIWEVRNY